MCAHCSLNPAFSEKNLTVNNVQRNAGFMLANLGIRLADEEIYFAYLHDRLHESITDSYTN